MTKEQIAYLEGKKTVFNYLEYINLISAIILGVMLYNSFTNIIIRISLLVIMGVLAVILLGKLTYPIYDYLTKYEVV